MRWLFAVALAIGLGSTTLSSCKWMSGSGENTEADTLQWATFFFEDSVSIIDARADQKMSISYPVINDSVPETPIARNTMAWIRQALIESSFPNWTNSSLDAETLPEMKFNSESIEAFATTCAKNGLDSMAHDMKSSAEEGFAASFYNTLNISVTEQTDTYWTLTLGHETYTGGAHGGYYSESATFSKATGKRMDWNLFDMTKKEEMRAMLVKGVKSYFNEFEEEKIVTDDELFERLILFDDDATDEDESIKLPFPNTPPCVLKNAIVFTYQQYEIAAYACGLPSFTLTVEEAEPLLSQEGRAFFGLK